MGLGYYSSIRNLWSQVQEMSQARCTGGRPLIIVTEDHENLPTINLTVQNVGSGPANITFEFSSPVESSDGFVLSDLAFFDERITSLALCDRIVCYWDELENLQPMYQEGRLEWDIMVTVSYQYIAGGSYSHDWEIGPMPHALLGRLDDRLQGRERAWGCRGEDLRRGNRKRQRIKGEKGGGEFESPEATKATVLRPALGVGVTVRKQRCAGATARLRPHPPAPRRSRPLPVRLLES
jgi:hypothetical protein